MVNHLAEAKEVLEQQFSIDPPIQVDKDGKFQYLRDPLRYNEAIAHSLVSIAESLQELVRLQQEKDKTEALYRMRAR